MQKEIFKYQLVQKTKNQFHAGSKAPQDISKILEKNNFKTFYVLNASCSNILQRIYNLIYRLFEFLNIFIKIKKGSLLLIQYPNIDTGSVSKKFLKILQKYKKSKLITLIHDINELRSSSEDQVKEFSFSFFLENTDFFISHNSKMSDYLVNRGFDQNRIVSLELFDYLAPDFSLDQSQKSFNKDLTIAGNLLTSKVEYLKYLKKLDKINFHLYGVNYKPEDFSSENTTYHGKFDPDELPSKLTHGFGLVWDGISADTCDGEFGKYLRYNNPHKLSLYIASGLPVVIWKQAAEAKIVEENGIGILVDSLYEAETILQSITQNEYENYLKAIQNLSEKVRNGYFLKTAITKIESL